MKKLFYLYFATFQIIVFLNVIFYQNTQLYLLFFIELIIVMEAIYGLMIKVTRKNVILCTILVILCFIFSVMNIEKFNELQYIFFIGVIPRLAYGTFKIIDGLDQKEKEEIIVKKMFYLYYGGFNVSLILNGFFIKTTKCI